MKAQKYSHRPRFGLPTRFAIGMFGLLLSAGLFTACGTAPGQAATDSPAPVLPAAPHSQSMQMSILGTAEFALYEPGAAPAAAESAPARNVAAANWNPDAEGDPAVAAIEAENDNKVN